MGNRAAQVKFPAEIGLRAALETIEAAASDLMRERAEPAPVSYEAWVRQMAECIRNTARAALKEGW